MLFSRVVDLGLGGRVSHKPGLMDWAKMAVRGSQGAYGSQALGLKPITSLSSFGRVLEIEHRSPQAMPQL